MLQKDQKQGYPGLSIEILAFAELERKCHVKHFEQKQKSGDWGKGNNW